MLKEVLPWLWGGLGSWALLSYIITGRWIHLLWAAGALLGGGLSLFGASPSRQIGVFLSCSLLFGGAKGIKKLWERLHHNKFTK